MERCPNCKEIVDVPDDEPKTYTGWRIAGALVGPVIFGTLILRIVSKENHIFVGAYLWIVVWAFLCFRREIQELKGGIYYLTFFVPFGLCIMFYILTTYIGGCLAPLILIFNSGE